jgi:hypothetical protein
VKYYIENHIWYIGYIWIDLESKMLKELSDEYGTNCEVMDARSYRYNNYAGDDQEIIYISYSPKHLQDRFKADLFDPNQTRLELKFMTNGCVNIVLTFVPKEPDTFSEFVKDMDAKGAETISSFRSDMLSFILDLLQKFIDRKIIECSETSLWGIPKLLSKEKTNNETLPRRIIALLSKEKTNKEKINFGAIDKYATGSDDMHGRTDRRWSALYDQSIISDDPKDLESFLDVRKEVTLRKTLKDSSSKDQIKCHFGNGKTFWEGGDNECDDIHCFLEAEAVLLSYVTIMSVSITFNTELSLILLKDKERCAKASVDDLRQPIVLLRTHLACTEMFIPSFSENLLKYYEIYEELESKWLKNRMIQQKEAEETLMQIANAAEVSKEETKAELLQFFLAAISAMTIFSVIQDVSTFILVDDSPDSEAPRWSLFSIILSLVLIVVFMNRPSKK